MSSLLSIHRRRSTILTAALATIMALASTLAIVPAAAASATQWVNPVADGTVVDSDRDGTANLAIQGTVQVGFDHLLWPGELRGIYEFTLPARHHERLSDAHLMIPIQGTSLSGTGRTLTLFASAGDGRVDVSDYARGRLVQRFDAFAITNVIYLDVTKVVGKLVRDGAHRMTLVIRPDPAASSMPGTFILASSGGARYGFQEAQLQLTFGRRSHHGAGKPVLVVQDIRFPDTSQCSWLLADITNVGDGIQPFGWSIVFRMPWQGITTTFMGQHPLVPGQRLTFSHNQSITSPGRYRVVISVADTLGPSRSALATFRVPCAP